MIQLRGKQQIGIDKVAENFRKKVMWQILYAPTGTGKTEMAFYKMLLATKKSNKCAMLMDRRVLVNQTSARLDKYGIEHGVLMAGHKKYNPNALIQIISEQTLAKRSGLENVKLWILDECHNVKKSTVSLIKKSGGYVVGLSASPFTEGLAEIYQSVASFVTTNELVEQKLLAPLKVFAAKEVDMTGAKKIYGEWSEGEAEERAMKITGDVVNEWQKRTAEFFGKPVKTIVFSAGVNHGQELADEFQREGFNFVSISYLDKEKEKEKIITEFNKVDSSIIGLIACDVLTKGFDCPDVLVGVSVRPFSKSFSSHVQQMGRVMRSHPDKSFALWICHSGNFLRFYDDWVDLYYNGVDSLKPKNPPKEKTEEEKIEKTCPDCRSILFFPFMSCDNCGWERPKKEMEYVQGETVEVEISADNAPTRLENGIKRHKVRSSNLKTHTSKAGKEGFKLVLNDKFIKYYFLKSQEYELERLEYEHPIEFDIVPNAKNPKFPEIELIFKDKSHDKN